MKDDSIHNAEYRRDSANAERQSHDGDSRETKAAPKNAKSVTEVLLKGVDQVRAHDLSGPRSGQFSLATPGFLRQNVSTISLYMASIR